MKIRTRFEKYVLDRLTFVVYLMDHNGNPLEVHYADDIQERERICGDLSVKYQTDNIRHYEDFSIDITNVNQR
jgi:hypothetical protein